MTNVEFFVGKAEIVLPEYYETHDARADVIVVDPPRKGCDETLLRTMGEMKPERIVYVSCDSATLARDLKVLCGLGYARGSFRAWILANIYGLCLLLAFGE
jgi:23S rRNA (uracil1939-C5)-methyltransferase